MLVAIDTQLNPLGIAAGEFRVRVREVGNQLEILVAQRHVKIFIGSPRTAVPTAVQSVPDTLGGMARRL